MFVSEKQLAVLQAIADRVSSVEQMTSHEKALEELRARPRWEEVFAEGAGEAEFGRLLDELETECLIEQKDYKGKPHLKLTQDALRVDELNTTHLF